jgi:hypothetical protein
MTNQPLADQSSNVAVSIGGSGARTAEALLYLCAAGLGPDSLTLVFVDADTNNGSLTKAQQLAQLYTRLQPSEPDGCPLFRTRITLLNPPAWTPFPAGQGQPKMSGFFDYAGVRETNSGLAQLMECLYTDDHRNAPLDYGFLGKPSIGAAVLAHAVGIEAQPWRDLIGGIKTHASNGQQVSIFSLGSIFGGTGAAGVPTVPKLLKDAVGQGKSNVCLGAALLLPYFSFPPPERDLALKDRVYASPDTFLLNSKEALRHYHSLGQLFNRLYLFGAGKLATQKNFSKGGAQQDNLPHFIELIAASGAADFFRNVRPTDHTVHLAASESAEKFYWSDHPEQERDRPALGNLGRLCFFYLSKIMPRLVQIRDSAPGAARTPWHQHLLARRDVSLSDVQQWNFFEDLDIFVKRFLVWLRDLQANHGNIDLQLADTASFTNLAVTRDKAQLSEPNFRGTVLANGSARFSLNDMWVRFCAQESLTNSSLNNRRAFESALYQAAKGG